MVLILLVVLRVAVHIRTPLPIAGFLLEPRGRAAAVRLRLLPQPRGTHMFLSSVRKHQAGKNLAAYEHAGLNFFNMPRAHSDSTFRERRPRRDKKRNLQDSDFSHDKQQRLCSGSHTYTCAQREQVAILMATGRAP